jgi:predicted 2-oxoglutarate/Fe(II)-dependent dioxygenase YbiX
MIIIDDFIKNERLLNDISKDDNFFGPNGDFHWWGGWFKDGDENNIHGSPEANTLKKQLIEEIWRWNSPWDFPRYNPLYLSGVEYWTGVYGPDKPNKNLGNHYDKDELHFKRTGEVVKPLMGTVYYPKEMDIDGGYLEIYTDGTDSEPERIKPIYNRLIIFEAGEYVHTVTPVTRGTRYAIAVNLWSEPPVGVYEKAFTIE